jgi:Na+/H+-dicarboxylate symporter/ABC-type amino acid transport substrate-binding protein
VTVAAATAPARERGSLSFSTQILVGLAAGLVVGVFFGERVGVLKWAADGFVKLLQMTVLPYVTLSIVGSLGNLQMRQARELAWRGGAVLAALWLIALTFALLLPLTFPSIESASFFSTTLVEQRRPFNFVDLYIPANPFYSLANNVVPAVVLFSIIVGVALIGVARKQILLDTLSVATEALARATRFVVRLTPYGLFAIAATTAGTLSLEQVGRLQVYLIGYVLVSLLVSLWVLPGLVSALTPIPMRALFSLTRNALITAFVAGDLFIVLPVLIGASGTLVEQYSGTEHAADLPAVIVPASFNFPHAGKLLSISFVLFAGWFADAAVHLADYPRLALMGILTFFGSLNVAVPFLLDQFRIPTDTFQLFLASGVINSRFGTLVAVMHTLVVALLGTCAMTGALRWEPRRLLRYITITFALTVVTIGGARLLFAQALQQRYTKDQVLAGMHLSRTPLRAVVHRQPVPPPASSGGDLLEDISRRGTLRVGYLPNSLPFAFFNAQDDLVGFDVELAHRLAADLKVGLEFVALDREGLANRLETGFCDIVMSGVVVTPQRASTTLFSISYLEETLAFLVPDEKRTAFEDWNAIKSAGPLVVAVPDIPYYVDRIRELVPDARLRTIEDISTLLASASPDVDAIALPAERGSAWTLMYPRYTVVVPAPSRIRIPLAYPLARNDQAFARFINTWLQLKIKDGTIDGLYDYWILGRSAEGPTRRWSIIRNVLHWVD